jgi:hypothetical protein
MSETVADFEATRAAPTPASAHHLIVASFECPATRVPRSPIRPSQTRRQHLKARLTLEMPETPADGSATDQIFEWLRTQVSQRQPTSSVLVIVLMDGQASL